MHLDVPLRRHEPHHDHHDDDEACLIGLNDRDRKDEGNDSCSVLLQPHGPSGIYLGKRLFIISQALVGMIIMGAFAAWKQQIPMLQTQHNKRAVLMTTPIRTKTTTVTSVPFSDPLFQVRTAPLSLEAPVSFVHISKCAGASFITDLLCLFPSFYPDKSHSREFSIDYQRQETMIALNLLKDYKEPILMTSVKNPRRLIYSLFMECRYDEWGQKVTTQAFPRDGTDEEDFEKWLEGYVHYDEKNDLVASDMAQYTQTFGCYEPANYQARHFASQHKYAHKLKNQRAEPDMIKVWQNYVKLNFVALADFYHESKCLLFQRIYAYYYDQQNHPRNMDETYPPSLSNVTQYLETCHCQPVQEDAGIFADTQIQHYQAAHRTTFRNLPASTLAKVEALTHIDVMLYKTALTQFMKEIAWLESDAPGALGRRVVCDKTLNELEPELAYLGLSVTNLYEESKLAGDV